MERLTKRELLGGHNLAYVSDDDCFDVGSWQKKFMGNAIDRLAAIEDILGDDYDLSRLRELVQADRDRRCVVLPCKVGERLWCINNYGEIEETVAAGFLVGKESVCIYYKEKMSSEYYNAPIGKVLFLTREAAEKALKGQS